MIERWNVGCADGGGPKWRRSDGGFTLAEVMYAVVLVSFVALGATAFCTHAATQMKWAQDQQIMMDYAEYYLELFKATDPNGPSFVADPSVSSILYDASDDSWTAGSGTNDYWECECIGQTSRVVRLSLSSVRQDGDPTTEDYLEVVISSTLMDQGRTVSVKTFKELQ